MAGTKWGIKREGGFITMCENEAEARRDNTFFNGILMKKEEPVWEEVDSDEHDS